MVKATVIKARKDGAGSKVQRSLLASTQTRAFGLSTVFSVSRLGMRYIGLPSLCLEAAATVHARISILLKLI